MFSVWQGTYELQTGEGLIVDASLMQALIFIGEKPLNQ
jgi:hypothetical protein